MRTAPRIHHIFPRTRGQSKLSFIHSDIQLATTTVCYYCCLTAGSIMFAVTAAMLLAGNVGHDIGVGIAFQAHSYNDFRSWQQLFLKGAEHIKIDPNYRYILPHYLYTSDSAPPLFLSGVFFRFQACTFNRTIFDV